MQKITTIHLFIFELQPNNTLTTHTFDHFFYNIIEVTFSFSQFGTACKCLPYAEHQYHSSIQSWHIADLISGITCDMPRCNWLNSYEWTESYRFIYVCLGTSKKSSSVISFVFWDTANLLLLVWHNFRHAQVCLTTPTWKDINLLLL